MLQLHPTLSLLPRRVAVECGFQAKLSTPFAVLGIRTAGDRLTGIEYLPRFAATLAPGDALTAEVCRQVECYLDDPDYHFDLPLAIEGTPFQRCVWEAIAAIPSGSTLTYREVAQRIGNAPRAVGGACGANRLPLVIPCHRVIAVGGIGGFMHARDGAPLEIKRWLLRHEGV
jgi:methylated-DNA-[protein]-cysteine S-methyltransferase